MRFIAAALATAALAGVATAANACDETIPGLWRIPGNVANLTWTAPASAWQGVPLKPGNHWSQVTATMGAGGTTVDAHFVPNAHHGLGDVSADCRTISWNDNSTCAFAGRAPTGRVNVHLAISTVVVITLFI